AAALGVDAVLVTPQCADPLYRRSIRVSMGTVFQVPWTRLEAWPGAGVELLHEAGFDVLALALSDGASTLDAVDLGPGRKVAFVLGAEGHGLKPATLRAADEHVVIPMAGGVDSLNVAAASAVVSWQRRAMLVDETVDGREGSARPVSRRAGSRDPRAQLCDDRLEASNGACRLLAHLTRRRPGGGRGEPCSRRHTDRCHGARHRRLLHPL